MRNLESFRTQLIKSGVATSATIVGMTEYAVSELEQTFNVRLPKPYRDFLLEFGSKCGQFWLSTEYSATELRRINVDFREAVELLREDGYQIDIPTDSFAVNTLSGQAYKYILTDVDVETCPLYMLNLFTGEVTMFEGSFWDKLSLELESACKELLLKQEVDKQFRRLR